MRQKQISEPNERNKTFIHLATLPEIKMASCNQSTRLMFVLFLSWTIPRLTSAPLSGEKVYTIRSALRPDLVIDAVDKVVQLKYYTGFRTQLWKFRETSKPDLYNIISVHYGTALDTIRIPAGALSGRTHHAVLRILDSSSFQQWNVTSKGYIVNAARNFYLDIIQEQYASGTRLQVGHANGRSAQLFRVEPEAARGESLWGAATLLKL